MHFEPLNCPKCGKPARGILETLSGVAELHLNEDGTIEYSGATEVFWDEQKTVLNDAGQVAMLCRDGHEWFAVRSDTTDSANTGLQPPTVVLPRHLELLLLETTSLAGTYAPEEALCYIEERLTVQEFDDLYGYLTWVVEHSLTFGHGNIQSRYAEYRASLREVVQA